MEQNDLKNAARDSLRAFLAAREGLLEQHLEASKNVEEWTAIRDEIDEVLGSMSSGAAPSTINSVTSGPSIEEETTAPLTLDQAEMEPAVTYNGPLPTDPQDTVESIEESAPEEVAPEESQEELSQEVVIEEAPAEIAEEVVEDEKPKRTPRRKKAEASAPEEVAEETLVEEIAPAVAETAPVDDIDDLPF